MFIKCWGSRGGIPVSGKDYIKYGGDTTCLEIRTKADDIIIIDAGTGIRRLGNLLIKENRRHFHLIFTHAHWDHLMGFPFFAPLFHKETELTICRAPIRGKYTENMITKIMAPPQFSGQILQYQCEDGLYGRLSRSDRDRTHDHYSYSAQPSQRGQRLQIR